MVSEIFLQFDSGKTVVFLAYYHYYYILTCSEHFDAFPFSVLLSNTYDQ